MVLYICIAMEEEKENLLESSGGRAKGVDAPFVRDSHTKKNAQMPQSAFQ